MNQTSAVRIEEYGRLYTLDEARQLLLEEAERAQEARNFEKKKARHERRYFIKQRTIGLALIVLSLMLIIAVRDATAAIFMIPIGLFIMLTKSRVLTE